MTRMIPGVESSKDIPFFEVGEIERDDLDLKDLSQLDDELEMLVRIFDWLRPEDVTQVKSVETKVQSLVRAMEAQPETAATIREKLQKFIVDVRFLPLYTETGILPRRSFVSEFRHRVLTKLAPEPTIVFSAKNLLDHIFHKPDDHVWVQAVSDETLMALYCTFIGEESKSIVERHLTNEALYALEMLSIWLAAEELEDELLRLDPSIFQFDSDFIAQEREISQFVAAYRARTNPVAPDKSPDASHAWVMLKQCEEQIGRFRRRALRQGSGPRLTYLLERLEQTLGRIYEMLGILDPERESTKREGSLRLFRKLVAQLSAEHSIMDLTRQTYGLLAKSVTSHASRTGEHYVTENRHEYLDMLKKGLGGGIFIAIMALIKIRIMALGLPEGWSTLWVSLNYGLGFVIIHMLHFTVATKQPAMTAAYIAERLEQTKGGMVERKDLAQLILKVGRSQFAAILGNVAAALPMALIIGFAVSALGGGAVMKVDKAAELMHGQNPATSLALFYAAVAGLWLFVSGLVAGYYDNRCLYLDLPSRIRQHPLLKRILSTSQRERLAEYIREHLGAIIGNFFFGVMLGVTGYIGYLLNLPLDIRHVAFSVSNVGFSSTVTWPGMAIFIEFVFFALLIGVVNLTVSFLFALNVALQARDIRLGGYRGLVRAVGREMRRRPREIFLPPVTEPKRRSASSH